MKIGIIGLGFLGGSMDRYFTEKGVKTYRYDKKGIGSPEEVNEADAVFVCVNTPYDGVKKDIDLSYVDSAVKLLNGSKTVVLRSTMPPGTTDNFQKNYPQHKFLFNPEFLRAKFAYVDFINPPRQLIGYTEKSKDVAREVLAMLPEAPPDYTKILPARSAELVKYAANTMLAVKVALANKMYDFSQAIGADYDEIKHLLGADARIGHWGLDVMYENFRGYNGTCFPKDVRTLVARGKALGVDVKWLEALDDENLALLAKQGMEADYGHPKIQKT
ncbi:MAG: hypothetical protein A3G49_06335 [Candidatus Sungbacteria bacterium RIFCSPLOWO2_12_FULL_41_11]|uniref:UDP-glucose/GDP-mannose dehydrogenase dimerisation domain-containing protein n=1 Tax=Candidatus Sungbacteria bacterium RIFCSPLOWO2_12_FULL_41_11 TaxID=1802286 RepID=A0A1G2LS09_9BACT|nr:MAG: UDP-glucose/GDP-mannose dehydrogenase dimerization [Parcubacteria group bacterium GW2011_GWA2_42_14]OHA14438.1 MAG: hypothetical protein A3G49_06335 [Candidatus Sungbacteria bacterium RIFCSPLOWO2_12_FULL_41_11]